MRKFILVNLILLCNLLNYSQIIEKENFADTEKDLSSYNLSNFFFDESSRQYILTFVKEKAKTSSIINFKLNYNFDLLNQNSEELSFKDANAKYPFIEYSEEWSNIPVVRVENNATNQMIIIKGQIIRELNTKKETNNYFIDKIIGKYQYRFVATDTIKPLLEGKINIPDDANEYVKSMMTKMAQKISLVTYISNEPKFENLSNPKSIYNRLKKSDKKFANSLFRLRVILLY